MEPELQLESGPRSVPTERRPTHRRRISIVAPAYNERDCVDELARRLSDIFAQLSDYDFEVFLIENGSSDDTIDKLTAITAADSRFTVLQMSKTFGCDNGMSAGMAHATGDACIIMTADLQDPPELIPTFVTLWEQGYDNVFGIVDRRHGTGPIRRLNSQLYYWLLAKLSDDAVTRNVSDFRLVDRVVYNTANAMPERNRFLRNLIAWTGFRSIGVVYERPERFAGETKTETWRLIRTAVNSLLSSSRVLLRLIPLFGMFLSTAALMGIVGLGINFVLNGVPFPGFGTLLCVQLLTFGIVTFFLGIMAQYVGLIFDEVQGRPQFIVRRTIRDGRAILDGPITTAPNSLT
ncbi:MAG TPA: glycosyltransferase [Candidatus Latescibacteria bacterium]|jgi:glycosyltransferase involved in cell wall biosynthesis|nr:glycosyltransferase [Candidatus Latescibacterota bacterium]